MCRNRLEWPNWCLLSLLLDTRVSMGHSGLDHWFQGLLQPPKMLVSRCEVLKFYFKGTMLCLKKKSFSTCKFTKVV